MARAYRTVGGCQQNNVRPLPLCYRSLSVLSASIRNASPSPLPTPLELGRLNTSVRRQNRCTFERPVVFAVGPYCYALYSARPPSSESRPPRPARAGAAARRRPGRSVSRRGPRPPRGPRRPGPGYGTLPCPLALHRPPLARGKWKCGGAGSHSVRALPLASRAGRGDHYLCGLTDKHISRIEQLLLPLKRRALIWALRPYPWRAWRIPACPQPAKTVHWMPSGYYLRGA